MAVNLVIVPLQPSPFDLWSGEDMAALIKRAAAANSGLKARVLVSRRVGNTTLGQQAHEAAGAFDIPVFRTEIAQRIALAEAALAGESIFQYAPDSAAAEEFDALHDTEVAREIFQLTAFLSLPCDPHEKARNERGGADQHIQTLAPMQPA